jgi:hypothetical protein
VWAWGCNDHGQLGLGVAAPAQLTPTPVPGLREIGQITTGGEVPISRENPGGGFSLALLQSAVS